MKNFVFACTLLSLWMLSGCATNSSNSGNGGTEPVLKSIQVAPSAPSVAAGLTQQMTATAKYSDGSSQDVTKTVTWSSSNNGVATVSSTGLATGKAAGSTTITATVSGVSGSTSLTVSAAQIKSLSVSAGLYSIAPNTTQSFQAAGTFTDGSVKNVTGTVQWTSSNTSVATINVNGVPGLAEGLAAGTSTITATSGNVSSSATLTVTNATLVSIAVNPSSVSIPLGTVQQFTAEGTFSDNTTQDITDVVAWSSSNSSIMSITASGLATAKNLTSTSIIITATSQGVHSTASATVNTDDLQSLVVTAVTSSIAEHTSLQLVATGTFNNGSTRNLSSDVNWSSSDTSVATVNSSGVVTGQSPSFPTVTITAMLGTFQPASSFTLTVTNAQISSISVAPATATIAPGTQLAYTATGTFTDNSVQVITLNVTWSSSNTDEATVAPGGVAMGVSAGSPTITASLEGIQGSATLTVSSATLQSIAVSPATAVLAPAGTRQYSAMGTYSDGSTQNITGTVQWASSDIVVASITSFGLVTGESGGTASITANEPPPISITSPGAALVVESSPLTSVSVTPATTQVAEKTGTQFRAIGTFADGSTDDLTSSAQWSATPGTIATVSSSIPTKGFATGVAPGTATITALFAGESGSATLTVTSATLTSITVTPSDPTVSGGNVQFFAQGKFSDGTTENLTSQVKWASNNVGVATINGNGLATATGTGSTTISASMNGVSGETTLTVQ
jgi:trimeric autotransporter adhesin